MAELPKATIISQGKTVIQFTDDHFLIMHPDGCVVGAASRANAEKIAKRWYNSHLKKGLNIGMGTIEWRGLSGA